MLSTHSAMPSPRILLVDDDVALLYAFECAFWNAGFTHVLAVGTFEEARQKLRQQPFDVLITDVRLGASNGLQLALRARDTNPGIQLIVYSGFADPVLRKEAEQLGAIYLEKPVTSARLFSLIHAVPQ